MIKTDFKNNFSEAIAEVFLDSSEYTDYHSGSGQGGSHVKKEARFVYKNSGYQLSISGDIKRVCVIVSLKDFWKQYKSLEELLDPVGKNVRSHDLPDQLKGNPNAQRLIIKDHDDYSLVLAALFEGGHNVVDSKIDQAGFDNGTVEENDDRRWHLRKERSSKFRQFAIEMHGTICQACDVDYSHVYGDLWNGFVEAHHLFPRSEIKELKKTDVRKEACVLCANCHRMIHRWMSSKGVKGRLDYNRNDLLSFRKEIIKSDAK